MTRIQELKEINKAAYKRGHVAAHLQMFVRQSNKIKKPKICLKTKTNSKNSNDKKRAFERQY